MPNNKDYITKILGIQGFWVKELVINEDENRVDIWLEREEEKPEVLFALWAVKFHFLGKLGYGSKGFEDEREGCVLALQETPGKM